MGPKLPQIIAYHPEIQVEKEGVREVVKLHIQDFASESQILADLAQRLKVQTVGEVVEAIRAEKVDGAEVTAAPEVSPLAVERSGGRVWQYSERVC